MIEGMTESRSSRLQRKVIQVIDWKIFYKRLQVSNDFYRDVAKAVGFLPGDEVLVVCGGPYDAKTLANLGLKNVVISNVDHHAGVTDLSPYSWEYQDAEALTRSDLSVDWTVVNAGLHHCASPHKALCEMLRVSRKGVVVLEARDSLLMRLANYFDLTPRFETEPALLTNGRWGGYRNTNIPNFIYRWTEREFEKTVTSYAPQNIFTFKYQYAFRLPLQRMQMSKSVMKRNIVQVLSFARVAFEALIPKQGNCFAMIAHRTDQLQPWLKREGKDIEVNLDYIRKNYDASKYKSE
jgi:ubiquinone/menaquinone biosynthesis C-methylase UbiE